MGRLRGGSGGGSVGGRGEAEDVGFEVFNRLLEVGDTCCFETVVGRGDEFLDGGFVFFESRVDVFLVDVPGALGLGEDEVEEEEEAEVGVEGDPAEKPLGPGLNEERAGEDNPVHEPWCKLGWVGCLEGFVAGE